MDSPRISKRKDKESAIEGYLAKHRLHEFMRHIFQMILREQPEDPYEFMRAKLAQASAALEPEEGEAQVEPQWHPQNYGRGGHGQGHSSRRPQHEERYGRSPSPPRPLAGVP